MILVGGHFGFLELAPAVQLTTGPGEDLYKSLRLFGFDKRLAVCMYLFFFSLLAFEAEQVSLNTKTVASWDPWGCMDIAFFHLLLSTTKKAYRCPNVEKRPQVDAGGRQPKAKICKLWIKSCYNTSCQEAAVNIQRESRRKNSVSSVFLCCISRTRCSSEILISALYLSYLTQRGLGKQVLRAKRWTLRGCWPPCRGVCNAASCSMHAAMF